MTVGPVSQGSPRNFAGSRRDSYEQQGQAFNGSSNRFTGTGYSESGTHSLPFTLHNNYNDVTLYQVRMCDVSKIALLMFSAGGSAKSGGGGQTDRGHNPLYSGAAGVVHTQAVITSYQAAGFHLKGESAAVEI